MFYQEFKILTVSMWWHERKKKHFPSSLWNQTQVHNQLCASLFRVLEHNCFELTCTLKKSAKLQERRGRDKRLRLVSVQEPSFCGWNSLFTEFHWLLNVGQCTGRRLWASRSVEHSGSFNNICLKIIFSPQKGADSITSLCQYKEIKPPDHSNLRCLKKKTNWFSGC